MLLHVVCCKKYTVYDIQYKTLNAVTCIISGHIKYSMVNYVTCTISGNIQYMMLNAVTCIIGGNVQYTMLNAVTCIIIAIFLPDTLTSILANCED